MRTSVNNQINVYELMSFIQTTIVKMNCIITHTEGPPEDIEEDATYVKKHAEETKMKLLGSIS